MDEIQIQIAQLQIEKQQMIETANLRAAWYDGRIFQLEQLRSAIETKTSGDILHTAPDGSAGDGGELQQPLSGT